MINLSFFYILWIAFSFTFFSSFFVFFARKIRTCLIGMALSLSAITMQFLGIDVFRSSWNGQIIVISLWILFLFQVLAYRWCLTTKVKKIPTLFILPFIAFITMAISLDLLTFLLGLLLFNFSFLFLVTTREKKKSNLLIAIRKACISFLSYVYGMSILFSREGTILLKELHLKLSRGNWDNWSTLGVGLLALSIVIELYAIIPLIGSKNEKV